MCERTQRRHVEYSYSCYVTVTNQRDAPWIHAFGEDDEFFAFPAFGEDNEFSAFAAFGEDNGVLFRLRVR